MVKSMNYTFFASDRLGNDDPTKTQDDIQSANYYGLASGNPFATDYSNEESQVHFANEHVGMVLGNVHGSGVGANQVGHENNLLLDSEQGRSLSRLSLMQRQFATVPYLGRGSVDPTLESQILHGDAMKDKKSATPSEDTFVQHGLHPEKQEFDQKIQSKPMLETATNAPRGGANTREINADYYDSKKNASL
jgi:hypothetical protein